MRTLPGWLVIDPPPAVDVHIRQWHPSWWLVWLRMTLLRRSAGDILDEIGVRSMNGHAHTWQESDVVIDTYPETSTWHCNCGVATHDRKSGQPCRIHHWPHPIADVAQADYEKVTIRLDDQARDMAAAGQPINAAKIRHQAAIAYRAAKAEQVDPEPAEAVPCRICRGVRVCDWAAHLMAGERT